MQLCSLSTHLVNWQIHYWKITLENIANTLIKSDDMRKELQWGLFQSDSCLMHCREITQHWATGHVRFLTNFSCFKENQIRFDTSIKTTALEKKKCWHTQLIRAQRRSHHRSSGCAKLCELACDWRSTPADRAGRCGHAPARHSAPADLGADGADTRSRNLLARSQTRTCDKGQNSDSSWRFVCRGGGGGGTWWQRTRRVIDNTDAEAPSGE